MTAAVDVFGPLPTPCDCFRPRIGVLFQVERTVVRLFGFQSHGVALVGYTEDAGTGAYRFWTGRRSAQRKRWPGARDFLAAGGVRAGATLRSSALAEAAEEASLPADFVASRLESEGRVALVALEGGPYIENYVASGARSMPAFRSCRRTGPLTARVQSTRCASTAWQTSRRRGRTTARSSRSSS